MPDLLPSSLGSGTSAQQLIVAGIALVVLATCFGKLRIALFALIPTLLLAGAANILAWLTGADGPGGPATTTPGVSTTPPATSAGPPVREVVIPHGTAAASGHPGLWLAIVLPGLFTVLLVSTALVRAARTRGRAEGTWGQLRSDQDGTISTGLQAIDDPYPDLRPNPEAISPVEAGPVGDSTDPRPWADPTPRPGRTSRRAAWRKASCERLCARMTWLAREFIRAAVPRPGRPARIDLSDPDTRYFLDAFTAAADILVDQDQHLRPVRLTAAVREAERRWSLLRKERGERRRDDDDNPAAEPEPH
jgi:hypothetical protein